MITHSNHDELRASHALVLAAQLCIARSSRSACLISLLPPRSAESLCCIVFASCWSVSFSQPRVSLDCELHVNSGVQVDAQSGPVASLRELPPVHGELGARVVSALAGQLE